MARRTHRELQLRIHASAECVGHGRGVVEKQKVEAARCFEAPGQRDMVFAGPPVSAIGAIVCGRPCGRSKPGEVAEAKRRMVHRSEEHTTELQSLLRISYAVSCSQKYNN